MWNGGGSARLVLLLALACCTYAPLNHEMQSNLRSSNGKYCLRHPPATSTSRPPQAHFTLKRTGREGDSVELSVRVSLPARADSLPPQCTTQFWVFGFGFFKLHGQRAEAEAEAAEAAAAQQQHKASRVNEKDTHVNFNFCFLFRFSLPRSRCLPQGLLKLVTSWPRGLTLPACPAPLCLAVGVAQRNLLHFSLNSLQSSESPLSILSLPSIVLIVGFQIFALVPMLTPGWA